MIDPLADMLADDDEESVKSRKTRVLEIDRLFPPREGGSFVNGGLETALAFHEAKSLYVFGFWMGTILTGMAAVDRLIAANLFGSGKVGGTPTSADLLALAIEELGASERSNYERISEIRNSYALFYNPMHFLARQAEASKQGHGVNEKMQMDAREVLSFAAAYFEHHC